MPSTAARVGPSLDGSTVALPWHVSQPELAGFIAMKVASAQIMEVVIMLLVAAGIFNTLFVSVMERLREFSDNVPRPAAPGAARDRVIGIRSRPEAETVVVFGR